MLDCVPTGLPNVERGVGVKLARDHIVGSRHYRLGQVQSSRRYPRVTLKLAPVDKVPLRATRAAPTTSTRTSATTTPTARPQCRPGGRLSLGWGLGLLISSQLALGHDPRAISAQGG